MSNGILDSLALDLATRVIIGASSRLRQAAFGPAQESALRGLLGESIRVILETVTRSGELARDEDYLATLRTRLVNFFSNQEAVEALISFAINSNEPLPVGKVHAEELG
jgi:hypothetical protein